HADHRELHSFPTRRSSDLLPIHSPRRCCCSRKVQRWSDFWPQPLQCSAPLPLFRRPSPSTSTQRCLIGLGGRKTLHCCGPMHGRSEEHTSELQSREKLVCR